MTGPQPTEDRLIMDLIKTNRRTDGETTTRKQYNRHGKYNSWQAANRFGSWREAKATAGIYKKQRNQKRVTDTELLKDLKRVNQETDGLMKTHHYRDKGKFSVSLIYNRFDSFPTARSKAYNIDI